jgi:hypothetical protein
MVVVVVGGECERWRHLGVDLEDVGAALEVRQAELDLAVQAAGTQQRRIQRVRPVRRHQHLRLLVSLPLCCDEHKHDIDEFTWYVSADRVGVP